MNQFSLFDELPSSQDDVKIQNGEYIYIPRLFSRVNADNYLRLLTTNIDWKQESMNMYGREVKFPRLTAWYGDNDKPYTFSGITLNPKMWTKELLEIKEKIEPICKVDFNSVLLNMYRDGNDSISWHTDAEKELGVNPLIASVNFGAERVFQLRHIETKERLNILLEHGSLLVMKGQLQHYWQHQIPKSTKVNSNRINLTFRIIKQ